MPANTSQPEEFLLLANHRSSWGRSSAEMPCGAVGVPGAVRSPQRQCTPTARILTGHEEVATQLKDAGQNLKRRRGLRASATQ